MPLVPVLAVVGGTRRSGRQSFRRAVVEGDGHCKAVEAWLTSFVIARDFCPWAKPAKKLGGCWAFILEEKVVFGCFWLMVVEVFL